MLRFAQSIYTLYDKKRICQKEKKMKQRRTRKRNVPLSHSNLSTHENLRSHFDPNGSYTGVPEKHGYPDVPDGEKPVQDADDL